MTLALTAALLPLGAVASAATLTGDAGQPSQPVLHDGTYTATSTSYATPPSAIAGSWLSPVDHSTATPYWRLAVDKPSTKAMKFQLCMWRHTPGTRDFRWETCSKGTEISDDGVYFVQLRTPANWWKKTQADGSSGWDFSLPPDIVRVMIKDPATGQLVMAKSCGRFCYRGTDIEEHVPITLRSTVVMVPAGQSLLAPGGWTGCPATWNCGSTTTTSPPTTTTTSVVATTTTTSPPPTTTTTVAPSTTVPPATTTTVTPTTAVAPTTTAPAPGATYRAALIGGGPAAGADGALRSRLTALGFAVTDVDDDTLTTGSLQDADVVVISSSVLPSKIPAWLADLAKPIVVGEAFATRTLRLSTRQAEVAAAALQFTTGHPVASGFDGTAAVTTESTPLAAITPSAGGEVAAHHADGSAAVVTFRPGAALADGRGAPAARVVTHFGYRTPLVSNDAGWQLFDNAVNWVLPRNA